VDTRPGSGSSPTLRLSTDSGTLVGLLTGELSPSDALAEKRAALDGERKALKRFVEAFAFCPDRTPAAA
jgi:hypothetical protein